MVEAAKEQVAGKDIIANGSMVKTLCYVVAQEASDDFNWLEDTREKIIMENPNYEIRKVASSPARYPRDLRKYKSNR